MAITLVQHSGASTTSASGGTITLSPSWGSATTANNLLVCVIGVQSAGPASVATITPESGWTLAVSSTCDLGNGSGRHRLSVYYIENASSHSGTSTWTSSGGYMGSAKAAIALLEYSGVATSSSLDKTATGAAATNGGGTPYTNDTSATTGTTATTSQADELFIGGLISAQGLSSITNSFTAEESRLTSTCFVAADKIVSSTGTANFAMTESSAGCFAGAMATFKAVAVTAFSHTSSGTVTFSGASLCGMRLASTGTGGITFSGSSLCGMRLASTGTGGITFSGLATNQYSTYYRHSSSGSILFDGESPSSYALGVYIASGGITFGSSALVSVNYNYVSSGGVAFSNSSLCNLALQHTATGSIYFDGISPADFVLGYVPSGRITFRGNAITTLKNRRYINSGQIQLSGNPHTTYRVNVDFESTWNIYAKVTVDFESSWDVSNNILRYYQITGECREQTCDEDGLETEEPCSGGSRALVVIAALDLSDLCEKMKTRFLNYPIQWPIASIQRWSRPVYTNDIDEIGVDQSCNRLQDQVFCHIPECLEFCIQEDLTTSFSATTSMQGKFYIYIASGGLLLSGTTDTDFTQSLITNGPISFFGSAIAKCNRYAYTTSGGITFAYNNQAISSNWQYTPSGGISFSGIAPHTGSAFVFTSTGGIAFSGNISLRAKFRHEPYGGITFSGNNRISRANLILGRTSGQVTFSGTSQVYSNAYTYTPSGSINLSGNSRTVSPSWHWIPSGGINLGGVAKIGRRTSAVGTVTFDGSSPARLQHRHVASGELEFGGSLVVNSSPSWHYTATGSILIGGVCHINLRYLGDFETSFSSESELVTFSPSYPVVATGPELEDESTEEIVSECGCDPTPLQLIMKHNLDKGATLHDFLIRNNKSLPTNLTLVYNRFDNTWRTSYHFRDSNENWNLLFEWGCVEEVGATELDDRVWKFSVFVQRNVNNSAADTRILYTFPTDTVCAKGKIKFQFAIDPMSAALTVPDDLLPRDSILTDGIGLFANTFWNNTDLKINIMESAAVDSSPTVDIKPIFPES